MAGIVDSLSGIQVISQADGEKYEPVLHRWSENAERRAKYVVFPDSAEEVARTVSKAPMIALRLISNAHW
jgi:FAD/FMN-containing dehydrogenase